MGVIKKNWPEFIASLLVAGLLWKVFEQSVLEHHFIIPTMFFTTAVVIGNVIFYSYKNYKMKDKIYIIYNRSPLI